MHTQCPECNTVFRITDAQLNAAGGRVRCGECHSVFNARQHLFERMPSAAAAEPAPAAPPPRATPEAITAPPPPPAPSADHTDALFAGEADTTAETVGEESTASALDDFLAAEEQTTASAFDDFLAAEPQATPGETAELDALLAAEAEAEEQPAVEESAASAFDDFLAAEPQATPGETAELDALLAAEAEEQPAVEESAASAFDDFLAAEPQATPGETAEPDALLDAEAEEQPAVEESAASAFDDFLAADQAADAATARYEIAADELDALLDAAEHEAEASTPAAKPAPAPAYEVDLDEFFASAGEEESTTPAAAAPAEDDSATHSAAAGSTAAPAPTDELFGEAQIESLLNPQDAENLELPWERDETERPAVVIDLSEDADTARDEFTDLGLSASGNEVDEFDLPEAQLTSARPLPPESPADASPMALPDLLVSEAAAPARSLAGILGWVLGSLLLLALLTAQYGYLNRELLVLRYPQLRPALELACHYTGCELPPRRDLGAITLLERDIRSHTSYQGALVITATLLNRADFAQPYPDVEVIMRDLGGNIVAARRFRPDQYLSGTHPAQLASQATAQLLLEVSDPGAAAVGFEFNFY